MDNWSFICLQDLALADLERPMDGSNLYVITLSNFTKNEENFEMAKIFVLDFDVYLSLSVWKKLL